MYNKMKRLLKKECGAVEVVEAALIFPIVIFVVIIFFFFGNVFYQQSKVDAVAVRAAEKMALYYTNPFLRNGSLPTDAEEVSLDPYRYVFGGEDAAAAAETFVRSELAGAGSGAFSGMDIQVQSVECELENLIVYQTARVRINYAIEFLPIKLIDGISLMEQGVATATSAADPAEFIRNIDMILDYAEITGLTEKLGEVSQFIG